MQLHSVTTAGSALAACLRTVATSGHGFGFLIGKSSCTTKLGILGLPAVVCCAGRVISRTSKVLQDAAGKAALNQPATCSESLQYNIGTGEIVTQQPEADITAYMCCPPGMPATLITGEPEGQSSLQTHATTGAIASIG